MKFNTLFIAAICAGTLFNACAEKTARENQLKYTHTTLVDGDAYAIFHKVGEIALVGNKTATAVAVSGDAKSKEVATKLQAFYSELIPALDTLATAYHVDFPIKGIPALGEEKEHNHHVVVDSTHAEETAAHHGEEHAGDYVAHAQHDLATVKEQLKRLSRNTNKDLQDLAKKYLALATDLYTAIGGKEEGHAHH